MFRFALAFFLIAAVSAVAQQPGQNGTPQGASGNASQASAAEQPAPAQEVLDAEAAIAKADWKTAAARLDARLASNPNDARALFDAGYVADAQNRLDDAVSLYRRSVTSNPNSFEAHLSLGLLLARQNKPQEARPELAAATELDPGEAGPALKARAWRALAAIDRTSDAAEASKDLLEALKLSPETEADTLLAAGLAEQAGEYEAAESAYHRVLMNNPKSAEANAGLAHLLIARKQYPEAETMLRAALEATPGDPALTAQLAAVLAAEDKAEAIPLLEKLHAAHPDNISITHMLAEVLAEAGDTAGSDRLYAALLTAQPNDAALLVAHGQNLIRQLKYAEAFATFDKATQANEANGDAWSGLAFAASKTNRPSVAVHALTMRSKYLPEGPSTYFLWATSYDSLHERANAITYYHHFLDSAAGKFPDQEWQARQRLKLLENKN